MANPLPRRTPALPQPPIVEPARPASTSQGPFTFVGSTALLFAMALMPGAHLAAGLLVESGLSVVMAALVAGLCFPALLLPTLPTRSRRAVMSAAGWVRFLFGLPAMIVGMILVMLIAMGSPSVGGESFDAIRSLAALLFAGATGICGLLLVLRDPSQDR